MQKPKISNLRILRYGSTAALAAITALVCQPAEADELAELRAQITALQQRLDVLEKTRTTEPDKPCQELTLQVNRRGLLAKNQDNFSFRIRPRIQVDGHFFPDEEDGNSEFYLRRVRPVFQGTAGPLSWRFMPELAGTMRILDAWGDLSLGKSQFLRIGKFKGVVGLERLQSFSKTLFIERGLASVLTPTREIGVEFHQKLWGDRLQWTLAAYNGVLDDTDLSGNSNLSGGDFDYGIRLAFTPWRPGTDSALAGLTFGIAATTGYENTTIADSDRDYRIRYRSSGRGTFFRYQDEVAVYGDRVRINTFLCYYNGPFGLLSEYVSSSYDMSHLSRQETIETQAWTVQTSWVLTGEKAGYDAVRPKKPFHWGTEQLGAFELGLRVHALEVDASAFSGDPSSRFARSNAVQKAFAWGAAFNWYLTDNLLIAINYEVTDYSGLGADRPTEEVLISRFQIDF